MNPYQVIKDFETALSKYTGAPYVVCVNSCTAAIMLALKWHNRQWNMEWEIKIPKHTYCSVPMAIINAGCKLKFIDKEWSRQYKLEPLPIWDCARRFTSGMYVTDQYQCISFSSSKILGMEQGGAILHDNLEADAWFRRMRFDGRTEGVDPKDDTFDLIGYHVPMLPSVAAQGILRLYHLPKHNPDMPDYDYPDLSKHEAFK